MVFPREGASFVTQMVKNLPAKPETQVQSLGQEEPLEKRMAPHSSVLAWRIPGMGEHYFHDLLRQPVTPSYHEKNRRRGALQYS